MDFIVIQLVVKQSFGSSIEVHRLLIIDNDRRNENGNDNELMKYQVNI